MKTIFLRILAGGLFGFFLLTGCVATKFYPAEGAKRYPPTKEIKLMRTSPPEDAYEILGIVSAEGNNENKLLENLKKKAMLVGADGLIVRRARGLSSVYESERRTQFEKYEVRLEGIAIRFNKPGGE